jgi:hypothetical protein
MSQLKHTVSTVFSQKDMLGYQSDWKFNQLKGAFPFTFKTVLLSAKQEKVSSTCTIPVVPLKHNQPSPVQSALFFKHETLLKNIPILSIHKVSSPFQINQTISINRQFTSYPQLYALISKPLPIIYPLLPQTPLKMSTHLPYSPHQTNHHYFYYHPQKIILAYRLSKTKFPIRHDLLMSHLIHHAHIPYRHITINGECYYA